MGRPPTTGFWILVIVAVVAVGFWYFTIYDTAKGKCERGDLNACVVWAAGQPARPQPRPAEATEPTVYHPAYDCYAAVEGHNAVVGIDAVTPAQCRYVQGLLEADDFTVTTVDSIPNSDRLICTVQELSGAQYSNWSAEVWDSGSAMYGSDACRTLDAASTPLP